MLTGRPGAQVGLRREQEASDEKKIRGKTKSGKSFYIKELKFEHV